MVNEIVARLFGGLGNQLFIYAAARSFALRYDADLYLDDVSGFIEDTVFQRQFALGNFTTFFESATAQQRLEPFSKVRRRFARFVGNCLHSKINGYVYDTSVAFKPELLQLPNRNKVYLEGYWQSSKYFLENVLQKELRIIPPEDHANREMARIIRSSQSTSVHLRFFDQGNHKMKERYYREATQALHMHRGPSHIFVFSDDPIRAEQEAERIWRRGFTIVNINTSNADAYADMWLMSLCDNNIIADSTFSWWAAWFNRHSEKLVLAPQQSLSGRDASWKTESLIPSDWILI